MKNTGIGFARLVAVGGLVGLVAPQFAHAQPGAAMPVPTPIPSAEPAPAPVAPIAPATPATPATPAPFAEPAVPYPQQVINAPSMTPRVRAAQRPTYDDGEKGPLSPSTATGYALLGTLSGPALTALAIAAGDSGNEDLAIGLGWLAAAGYLAGPSAGRWYAGETGAGTILARGGGAALMIGGIAASICFDSCSDEGSGPAMAMLAGAGLFVGATIYDIATASDAARTYNRAHRNNKSLALLPLVKQSEGHTTTGLALSGSF